MKPNIEVSDNHLKDASTLLNRLLADEYVLYTKTWGAHWNVEGPNFIALHQFLETQYEQLAVIVDRIAERIRSLGHFALWSLKDFLSVTDMLEGNQLGNQKQIIQTLTNDHETIIRIIRNDIAPITETFKDLGTADFVTGVLEQHEKMAWMLRAHLSDS